MKLPRYPTNAEWEKIVALGPGVRMHKEKKTLFYNGEELCLWDGGPLVYDWKERRTWEVIIIFPGVEVIPKLTFYSCKNVKTVIMADSVKRIEWSAFLECYSLVFIRLSRNLQFIGHSSFYDCESLSSIFIPPSCTEINDEAFCSCKCLIILGLSQTTELGERVFHGTALIANSLLEADEEDGRYSYADEEVVQWVKSINNEDAYAFHRLCCSHDPDMEQVYQYVKDHGLVTMKRPNRIGITPSQYLAANPYTEIEEGKLVKRYVLERMGEVA
ncbi:hypothetical protein CTEN210_03609 [Chaetoceros tenuissimus]|uniref:Leucine-rich repeat domain-containing protein n=1 Tax=Chaetoceros tenuissimus TaxID=426638 RepID=A0AAD3H256_9STRA|nr:hypothetical protein CTEN210_03609 [Chaetoceros tenuissimus]